MQFIFGDGTALAAYAAPARKYPAIWRTIACILLTCGGLLGLTIAVGVALTRFFPDKNPLGSMEALATTGGTVFALAAIAVWWPLLWLAMLIANRRGLGTLFPPTQNRPFRLFATGFLVACALGVLGLAFGAAFSPIERSSLSFGAWLSWAPLAVILLLLQTGAEEIVFRGYLLQQMAARFRSAWWAWALAPSLLFGALHFNPLAPGGAWVIVAVTTLGGFILAVVTARTGGLAAAWGLHMGVNTMALMIVGPPDYLSGLSLWHLADDEAAIDRLALFDLVFIAATALAAAWWFKPRRS